MDKRGFVRIEAEGSPEGPKHGTGYRIGHDRILTAAHILRGAQTITLRLELSSGSHRSFPAVQVWSGAEAGLDAAVLAFESSDPPPSLFVELSRPPIRQPCPWHSHGFAIAAGEGASGVPAMVGLSGRAYDFQAKEATFELTVEAPPEQVVDWRGISGAPVIVENRILGMIVHAPARFGGERLGAVAMPRLLREESFRAALEPEERRKKRKRILEHLEGLFSSEPMAPRALARQVDAWDQALAEGGVRDLVRQIGEHLSIEEVLRALNQAHLQLVDLQSAEASRAAGAVEEILAWTVPFLFEKQLVTAIPSLEGGVVLRVPVTTPTLAEIAMASLEQTAARFQPPRDLESYPIPLGSWPQLGPETGIDPGGRHRLKDFLLDLAREYLPEEDLKRVQSERYGERERLDELAGLLDDELSWRSERADPPFRPAFLFPGDWASSNAAFLSEVGRLLPSLKLIQLDGNDLRGERRLCRPLRDLLYRAHTQTTRSRPT